MVKYDKFVYFVMNHKTLTNRKMECACTMNKPTSSVVETNTYFLDK